MRGRNNLSCFHCPAHGTANDNIHFLFGEQTRKSRCLRPTQFAQQWVGPSGVVKLDVGRKILLGMAHQR
jgi:hypothetical protein